LAPTFQFMHFDFDMGLKLEPVGYESDGVFGYVEILLADVPQLRLFEEMGEIVDWQDLCLIRNRAVACSDGKVIDLQPYDCVPMFQMLILAGVVNQFS